MLGKEAESKGWPVQILDPQPLTLSVVASDKDGLICNYVAKVMSISLKRKKDFLMFTCNTGGHWIVVVISLRWGTVWYVDSNQPSIYDIDIMKTMLDK